MKNGDRFNPYKHFFGAFIPNWLLKRTEISERAKLVYARLGQFAGKDGECFPKQDTLAKEIGSTRTSVNKAIAELEKFGLIESRQNGLAQPNSYFFLYHEWIADNESSTSDVPIGTPEVSDEHIGSAPTALPSMKRIKEENQSKAVFDFESIWKDYPNKQGRKEAIRHFSASVKSPGDFENIKKALQNYNRSIVGKDVKYIKHGSTWFNDWQDWVNPTSVMMGNQPKVIIQDPGMSQFERTLRQQMKNEHSPIGG